MKYNDEATKTAVYIRVSSSSQDETSQIEGAERWLDLNGISKENVIYYNEHSLSANKVKMSNRPQLMALRRDIRAGVIKRLLVYTRCRIARNFYEYIEIVEEFYQYKVEVIFTNRETPPFARDFLLEGVHGIQVQSEGVNIKRRLKDVHDINPPQKFGFIKTNRKYGVNQAVGFEIQALFNTVTKVKGKEDLISLINNYKKILDRNNVEDIWKMLRSPFYAAHCETDGFYFELNHVEPIVSLNIFKEVQEILDQYEDSFIDGLIKTCYRSVIEPCCGICGKVLTHKKNKLGHSAYYCCSKHNIKIFVNSLDESIRNTMKKVVYSFSQTALESKCKRAINKALKGLKLKEENLMSQLKEKQLAMVLSLGQYPDVKENKHFKDVIVLKNEINEISNEITNLSNTKILIDKVINITKQQLFEKIDSDEFSLFCNFLVHRIEVFHDYLGIDMYLTEFTDLKGDMIYE